MKRPIFIVSFDCEGKWGMADHLTDEYAFLTNDNLKEAYRNITNIMDNHNIKGTFGFVGALTMSPDEYKNSEDLFLNTKVNGKPWLERFFEDSKNRNFDGWFNPQLLEVVRSYNFHEIASHGFTHIPLKETMVSEDIFLKEMNSMKIVMERKDIEISTFIYPRNLVGYTSLLKQYGIKGFRESFFSKDSYYVGKIKSLLSELNVFQYSQNHSDNKSTIRIPSGYFLNWRFNLRKQIPLSITVNRWKHAIQDAITNNRVIHLWSHPHNFINGDHQYKLFEDILKLVAEARDDKKIVIMTQKEYCENIARKIN